jgi:hypothetical protein
MIYSIRLLLLCSISAPCLAAQVDLPARQPGGEVWAGGPRPGLVSQLWYSQSSFVQGDTLFLRAVLLNSADTVVQVPPKACDIQVSGLPAMVRLSAPGGSGNQTTLGPGEPLPLRRHSLSKRRRQAVIP